MNTNELFSLQGRIALVTGGSRGIGRMIAKGLLCQGAKVYITARKAAACDATAQELSAFGTCISMPLDVSHKEGIQELVKRLSEKEKHLDILVNNAGITRDTLLMRMSEEQWDEVMRVNLKSVFNLTKAVIKPMLKAKSGSIINMSSVVGVKGNAGQANYAASKAGIIGFTKSVAAELGSRNIRCNAIAPGFIETEMTGALDEKTVQEWRNAIPLKRGGSTEDVAQATLFLASEMSAYITGQTLHVCGGMLM